MQKKQSQTERQRHTHTCTHCTYSLDNSQPCMHPLSHFSILFTRAHTHTYTNTRCQAQGYFKWMSVCECACAINGVWLCVQSVGVGGCRASSTAKQSMISLCWQENYYWRFFLLSSSRNIFSHACGVALRTAMSSCLPVQHCKSNHNFSTSKKWISRNICTNL